MSINNKINSLCIKRAITGCSISVFHNYREIFDYSFGYSNVEKEIEITSDSVYHIASITKPLTAIVTMVILNEHPKYTLHTRVYDIITQNNEIYQVFKKYSNLLEALKEISILHLITHRSGIRHYNTNEEFTENKLLKLYSKNYLDNLAIFGRDKLLFKPGEGYHYSSYGYILLTILIEIISGQSYYQSLKSEILEPLNLKNILKDKNKNTVNQYYRIFRYIENTYKKYCYSDIKKIPETNLYIKGGAGMLMSNASDIAKLGYEVTFGDFLDANIKNEIFRGYSHIDSKNWYGLGFHLDKKSNPKKIWHSGGAVGGCAYLEVDLEKRFSISVLCNTQIKLDFIKEAISQIYIHIQN